MEQDELDSLITRLETLQKSLGIETKKLLDLQEEKTSLESDIQDFKAAVEEAKEGLTGYQAEVDASQAELERIKKTASRATKAYERVIKEIAALNDSIEKLAGERLGVYRRCKLEEIELPLLHGNLDAIPLEDVRFLS